MSHDDNSLIVAGFDVGETTGIAVVKWAVSRRFKLGDLIPIAVSSVPPLSDDASILRCLDMVRTHQVRRIIYELPFSNTISDNQKTIRIILSRWAQLQTMMDPGNTISLQVFPSQWKPVAKKIAFYRPKDVKPFTLNDHCKDALNMVGWVAFSGYMLDLRRPSNP